MGLPFKNARISPRWANQPESVKCNAAREMGTVAMSVDESVKLCRGRLTARVNRWGRFVGMSVEYLSGRTEALTW